MFSRDLALSFSLNIYSQKRGYVALRISVCGVRCYVILAKCRFIYLWISKNSNSGSSSSRNIRYLYMLACYNCQLLGMIWSYSWYPKLHTIAKTGWTVNWKVLCSTIHTLSEYKYLVSWSYHFKWWWLTKRRRKKTHFIQELGVQEILSWKYHMHLGYMKFT